MEGGLNLFSDGWRAAADVQKDDPEAFRALTKIPICFSDVGEDMFGRFNKVNLLPTVE